MTNEEYIKQSIICTITMLADKIGQPLPFMGLQRQSLKNLEELRDNLIEEYNETLSQ